MSVMRMLDLNRSVVLRRTDGVEVLIEITPAYRADRTSPIRSRMNGALRVADSFWSGQAAAGSAAALLLGIANLVSTAVSRIGFALRGRSDWTATSYRVARTSPTAPGAVHRSFALLDRETLSDRASATERAAAWADELIGAGSSVVRYPS